MSENFAMRLLAWALLYHHLVHCVFALKQVRSQEVGAADHLVHAIAELQAIVNAGCPTTMEQLRARPLMKKMQPGTASMLHLEAHTRDNYAQPRLSSKEFKHLAADARAAAVACEVQRRNAKLDKEAERQMVPAPMPINALDDVTMATLQMYNPTPHVMLIAQVTCEQVGYAAPPELPAGPAAAPPAPAMPPPPPLPPPPLPPPLAPPVPLVPPPPADVQAVPPPPAVSVSPPTQAAAAAPSTSLSIDDLAERIDNFLYTARSGSGGDAASSATCLQAAYSGNVSAETAPQPQQLHQTQPALQPQQAQPA